MASGSSYDPEITANGVSYDPENHGERWAFCPLYAF